MNKIIVIAALCLAAGVVFAGGAQNTEDNSQEKSVTASSTWTAAFIEASGYRGKIQVLAPADYRHPSEYELLPSQVAALHDTDYFVYAGYEAVAKRAEAGSLQVGGEMIQIQTVNTSGVIAGSIRKLAEVLGNAETAENNIQELISYIQETRAALSEAGYGGTRVVCHRFLQAAAEEMGFKVVGVFGPAPPNPTLLKTLSEASPELIIDNWHVDTGKAVAAVLPDVPRVLWINFPGHGDTRTLKDVLVYNRSAVLTALEN